MERLLSLDEVCDLLQLGHDAVRRAVRRGDLVGSKPGNRLRFRSEDVEAYIDSMRIVPVIPGPREAGTLGHSPLPIAPRDNGQRISATERIRRAQKHAA